MGRSRNAQHGVVSAWILADQMLESHPALQRAEELGGGRENVHVVLIESNRWMRRLPFHRKRQTLILSAVRHYAEELRGQGYSVAVEAVEDYEIGLKRHIQRHAPTRIVTMEAAEYDERAIQRKWAAARTSVPLELVPNGQFLVSRFNPIPDPEPGKRYVMEHFYRAMRRRFQVLLEPDGSPIGGAWNFDADNRQPLPRGVRPPSPPSFEPDAITREAMAEVESEAGYVGSTVGFQLAVTRAQARSAFADFLEHRLPDFGPYEDAMTGRSDSLYHSVLSPQMNLGLLEPLAMVQAAEEAYRAGKAPLNSVEGFIRQILGWREFMYWQYWRQMPGFHQANAWSATEPLPEFFWTADTEMSCLRRVIGKVLEHGYSHHIERLMVICNYALLAGIDPAAVNDWFFACYLDAHDWVVTPNVIGMGLNADGGLTATKPYIASAAYIHRMSDYCSGCVYNPKIRTGDQACPFNTLYWNFLLEHESKLRGNPRLGSNVLGLKHLSTSERAGIVDDARRLRSD